MHHFHHIEYIFTGELFLEQRSYWHTPFKFNGKELDAETGLYYYGARYYTPEYGIWLSVDPLSDKYPSMSAFMYCAGNPVVLVDPDGRDIVDADGNVIYTHKDGWSDKASKGAKIIGNAMMETETGKNEFNKLVDSDAKIQLALSDETHFDAKTGSLTLGNMNPTSFKASEDGSVVKLESAIITVFSGSIDAYINKGGAQKDNSEIGKLVQEMQATVTEMIGAVAGHEAVHTSPKNLRQQWGNTYKNRKNDIEKEPDKIKLQILQEFYDKRNK
jgi:RHS repeat-associated protein